MKKPSLHCSGDGVRELYGTANKQQEVFTSHLSRFHFNSPHKSYKTQHIGL